MRNPPPEIIATWPKPNYVNPEYQGPQVAIVGITLLTLSVIIVCLRMYVRIWMRRSASWDDWLMVSVMPVVVAATVVSIVATHYGWGIHIWDNKKEWLRPSRKLSWASQVLYITIMLLVKSSILTSYLRFFTSKPYRAATYVMLGVLVAWWISYAFALFFNCRPLRDYWDAPRDAKCVDELGKMFSASITNFVTDLIVLILPIPTLWKLRLPIKDRVILIILMSLGLIACVASALKTYYTYRAIVITYDVSWEGYNVWLWSDFELNLSVICPSIPILRPFAQKYLPLLGFKTLHHHSGDPDHSYQKDHKNPKAIYRKDTLKQISERYGTGDSTEALELGATLGAARSDETGLDTRPGSRRRPNDWL
ncbi:hypothetical protein LOZ51_005496 [Ophidiomyces ophidiicola]|nr:hypothetical protein LOZ54_005195 [Ophidiomyces ophidiicola]KAI1988017.1 hypothetical protein LOZ51_005496 [Ophidiomyces ophidiicola]